MLKKNVVTLVIVAALVAVIIGGTMAWFTDQAETANTFTAGTVDIEAAGAVPMGCSTLQNWNPGDENYIKYTFTNNGTKRLRFRVGLSGAWEDELSIENVGLLGKDGEVHFFCFHQYYDDPIEMSGRMSIASVPESTWDMNDDWTFRNGYLYYGGTQGTILNPADSGILLPGESVELIINVKLDGPTTGNAYQGKEFNLNGLVQAIQASHDNEWNWDNVDFETGLED